MLLHMRYGIKSINIIFCSLSFDMIFAKEMRDGHASRVKAYFHTPLSELEWMRKMPFYHNQW